MDCSPLRRGRPSAHVSFARWHHARGLTGSPERFGESAAVLLGDMCLVWAEQMLRQSGLDAAALDRAWPRYDEMRTELVVGQFADLVNDAGDFPTLDHVLDVSRRKSGNYTVRRPLEIGSALSDCDGRVVSRLSGYGTAIGEAFQLRDDLLGVFGAPTVTGKPSGVDLSVHKATSVVVAAHQLADRTRANRTLGVHEWRRPRTSRRRPVARRDRRHRRRGVDRTTHRRAAGAARWTGSTLRRWPATPERPWSTWPPYARTGQPDAHRQRSHRSRRRRRGRVGRPVRVRCSWPAAGAGSPSSNAANIPVAASAGPTSADTGSTRDRPC